MSVNQSFRMELDREQIGQDRAACLEDFDNAIERAETRRLQERGHLVDGLMVRGIDPEMPVGPALPQTAAGLQQDLMHRLVLLF